MLQQLKPAVALALLALAQAAAVGAQLNACPGGDESLGTAAGSVYSVCQEADFRGTTASFLGEVATLRDCALACEKRPDCVNAVYDKTGFGCHLKSKDGLTWVSDPRFTTLKLRQKFSTGVKIDNCVVTESTTGNNAAFGLCKQADYAVPSLEIVGNVASAEACGATCASRRGCANAVFDKAGSICHIKGNLTGQATTNWNYNKRYDTLQLIGKADVADVTRTGRWSPIIKFPIIPVAAYVAPSGPSPTKLLVFSSWGERAFSGPTGKTQFAEWDYTTGVVSRRTITNTKHDMFCPGISALPNGQIVITGGENAEAVSIYDPVTNAFTKGPDMVIPRGYQTSTTLSDGRIFTIGGSFSGGLGGKKGEVYDPTSKRWTLLPGTDPNVFLTTDREGMFRQDNHAWLYAWRRGSVFQAGPSRAMNWFYTNNAGSSVGAGTRPSSTDQMCGINVMFDAGKILSAGGSADYNDSPALTEAHVITLGEPGVAPSVTRTSDMAFGRGFANAVVLPDGKVVVTGGQKRSLVFTDIDSALVPEMWDPNTGAWTQMAAAQVPRNYHSVGILLPDGTVFVGGGGMCPAAPDSDLSWCDLAKDHFDGEVFSPPYLFAADGSAAPRPVITGLSSASVRVGATIQTTLQGDEAGVSFVMVRMGSATHSINSDQRRIPVTVNKTGAGTWAVKLPADSGVLLPGPWYLFAMSQRGTPSIARTVLVAP
ncbi:hypothetical protein F5X68DRAFT_175013 [Plectosphaerella plurivora]|uniref:Apple domain-containing protein n=1 Tax=Plectosphaerella plurivora TaxID=936078 RepID=A0A9P9A7U9_9PEZI|nr:hypothetical protein F5X68DRAFT_175013 [Plectosphaerella plurivora]